MVLVVSRARTHPRSRAPLAVLAGAALRRVTASFRPSLSMLGWALNEEQNLADYVSRAQTFLRSVSDDYELVLIDDGSTDRTWSLALELKATRAWMTVLKNDRNRGPGFCYRRAIAAATKEYFMAQTVDWAYDIDRLGRVFDELRRYDVLQGVRPDQFSWAALSRRSDNLFKAVVSFTNYALVKLLFRLPFGDFQNITVCPTRLARSLQLDSDSSFTNPEVMMKLYWGGASFLQVAVPFQKRGRGKSSGTRLKAILTSILEIFSCWFRWIVLRGYPNRTPGSIASLDL
jgi:glycosyltransferase involved in cell wall biosynthesis